MRIRPPCSLMSAQTNAHVHEHRHHHPNDICPLYPTGQWRYICGRVLFRTLALFSIFVPAKCCCQLRAQRPVARASAARNVSSSHATPRFSTPLCTVTSMHRCYDHARTHSLPVGALQKNYRCSLLSSILRAVRGEADMYSRAEPEYVRQRRYRDPTPVESVIWMSAIFILSCVSEPLITWRVQRDKLWLIAWYNAQPYNCWLQRDGWLQTNVSLQRKCWYCEGHKPLIHPQKIF